MHPALPLYKAFLSMRRSQKSNLRESQQLPAHPLQTTIWEYIFRFSTSRRRRHSHRGQPIPQVNAVTLREMPTTNSQNLIQKKRLACLAAATEILQPVIVGA